MKSSVVLKYIKKKIVFKPNKTHHPMLKNSIKIWIKSNRKYILSNTKVKGLNEGKVYWLKEDKRSTSRIRFEV